MKFSFYHRDIFLVCWFQTGIGKTMRSVTASNEGETKQHSLRRTFSLSAFFFV